MHNRPKARVPLGARVLLLGLPLASGAGLVIYITAELSLPLAIATVALTGTVVAALVWSRLAPMDRMILTKRAALGGWAGLIATICYDLTRYSVVALFSMSFQPFHAISLFGEALIGEGMSAPITFAVGLIYHLINGVSFGIAYSLVFHKPSWWTGVLWGVGLELFMALLYPSWLRIQMLGEFLEVSALGHLVYGSVLGLVLARMTKRGFEPAREPSND